MTVFRTSHVKFGQKLPLSHSLAFCYQYLSDRAGCCKTHWSSLAGFYHMMELVDIQTVYVKIPVPEDEVSVFKKGQEATIKIGALGKQVSGKVKEIGVSADFLSHTYPVKIEVSNTDLAIKPGMVCEVATNIPSSKEGVLVSNKAVQIDINGNQYVMVLLNGKVEKRMIQTTTAIDKYVLVQAGLKVGEEVVTDGQQKLESGMSVNVIR